MIIVFIVMCLAITALGLWLINKLGYDFEFIGFVVTIAGGFLSIVCIIATVVLTMCVSDLTVIDEKISMYEKENTAIENQIAETVTQYMIYENEVFSKVAPENAVTMVALYPELKSDTLVQKQIEVYFSNAEQIKSLKEQKISGSVCRWWLYFGG